MTGAHCVELFDVGSASKQALGIEIFFLISGEDSRFKAGGQPLDCFSSRRVLPVPGELMRFKTR
jgi:hypothetical protein